MINRHRRLLAENRLMRGKGQTLLFSRMLFSRIGFDLVKYLATLGILGFLFLYNSVQLGYNWQWYRVGKYLVSMSDLGPEPGLLLQGLAVTVRISVVSLALSSFIGLASALLKLSSSLVGRIIAEVYIELIRNTPLLIQLLFWYFVIAPVFELGAFSTAVIALSLFEGAYASEIIRGGILAVPRGQWEAAYSLGMSKGLAYRWVVLPQAIRTMLPPLAGQGVSLIKDSALVSAIAVYDLTMQGQAIVAETFLSFEIWFTVALLYLAMTLPLSQLVRFIEKK